MNKLFLLIAFILVFTPNTKADESICNNNAEKCYNDALKIIHENLGKSLSMLTESCEMGYALSCLKMGNQNKKDSPNKAKAFYKKSCFLGDGNGCMSLANQEKGSGNEKDYLFWMGVACHKTEGMPSANACYIMGVEMMKKKEQKFSFNYFKKSCVKGAENACRFADDITSLDPIN